MAKFSSLEVSIGIVSPFQNTSLSGCKGSLHLWRESDINADDDSQKQQKDLWSTNLVSSIGVDLDDSSSGSVLEIEHSFSVESKTTQLLENAVQTWT
jgi:hypothetical protein